MTTISRSAEFNRYRPVSPSRAEQGAERNQAYREVERDFRADNNPARQAELESITAKQQRGETLTPHEQGLIDGQRRTTSTTETSSPGQTATQRTLETSGYEQELASGNVGREWAAFQGSHTSGDVNGSFHNTVEGQALTAGASANGSVAFDPANGKIIASGGAEAQANLVSGSVEGHVDSPVGTTSWQAAGNVGAEASVQGQVVMDPLNGDVAAQVGGEAFAGARASGEVSQEIGPATATVGAEAFAGIGAEFEANVGLQDGKLSANFDVGAALGIGASVEFGVEVDVGEAVDTAVDAAKSVGNGISNAAEGVKDFVTGW